MKKIIVILLFTFSFSLDRLSFSGGGKLFAQSGTISTFAGNGKYGSSGDGGPATVAELYYPTGVAFDSSGNLYIASSGSNVIRKVNASGIITLFAGNYLGGYSGDGGTATAAELNLPIGIGFDASGNLYIADNSNNVIRKVNTSGIITTIAGKQPGGAYSGDGGPATAAELNGAEDVTCDASGNLYIADYNNNVIRKVNALGIISTFAGNNAYGFGFSGDGGPATNAEIWYPGGVACDASGNLYLTDRLNCLVRKVNTLGIISTYAGVHQEGYGGDGGPATAAKLDQPFGLRFDIFGNLYIADIYSNVLRKVDTSGIITTIAGNYWAAYPNGGYSGNGGPATNAELNVPTEVACDAYGNLYISDQANWRIRKVSISSAGINEITEKEGVGVYPNPASVKIMFDFKELTNGNIEIYDITGRTIFNEKFAKPTEIINCSGFGNGVYFYRALAENGALVGEGKIIIVK